MESSRFHGRCTVRVEDNYPRALKSGAWDGSGYRHHGLGDGYIEKEKFAMLLLESGDRS